MGIQFSGSTFDNDVHGLGVNPISVQKGERRVGRKIRRGQKRKRKEEKDEEEGRRGVQELQNWLSVHTTLTEDSGLVLNTMLSGSQLPLTSAPGDLDTLLTRIDTPTYVA